MSFSEQNSLESQGRHSRAAPRGGLIVRTFGSLLAAALVIGVMVPSSASAAAGLGLPKLEGVIAPTVETVALKHRPAHRPGGSIGHRPVIKPNRPVIRPPHHARPPQFRPPHRPPVVIVRPWHRKHYFGRVVAGVVIGSIVYAAIAGSVPTPPAPGLCWYWTDPTQTRGYWDYCS